MSRINWPVSVATDTIQPAASPVGDATWVQATAGGFAVAGPWAAVYRVAYLRAKAALEPSKFQKMMEPCWN